MQFYYFEDRPVLIDAMDRVVSTSEPYDLELRLITARGNLRYVRTTGHPICVDGRVVRLQGTFQDVTKPTLAMQAVAREHQRLLDVLHGTAAGTWEWNMADGVMVWNERWAEMLGYTLHELGSQSIETWNSLCHPEDKAAD